MRFFRALKKPPFKMKDGMRVVDESSLNQYLGDRSALVNKARLRSLMNDDKISFDDKKEILDFANEKACRFTSGDERFIVRLVRKYWNKYGGGRQ